MESFPKMLLSSGYALAALIALSVYLNYGLSASVLTVWLGGAVIVILMAVADFALHRLRQRGQQAVRRSHRMPFTVRAAASLPPHRIASKEGSPAGTGA